MALGFAEAAILDTFVLEIAGLVLFGLCAVAQTILDIFLVEPVPDAERPPELRGPLPGGLRWGSHYYNSRDPRWRAYTAKGYPIMNLAHPRNRGILVLQAGGLLLSIVIIVVTSVVGLLE
jgi:hypothetical protein